MNIKNGTGKAVSFNADAILREASQDSNTSIVTYEDDGKTISLSQHSSGDWDISVNEEPVDEYAAEDSRDAVAEFMRLCVYAS